MGFRPTKAHRNSTVVIHSTRYSRSLPHRRIAAASGLSGASPVPGGRRCVLSASSLSAPLFAGHVLVLRWISDTGAEKVSLVRCRGAATRSEEDESQSPEIIQMKKERGGSEILMTKIFRLISSSYMMKHQQLKVFLSMLVTTGTGVRVAIYQSTWLFSYKRRLHLHEHRWHLSICL
ncbi:uncharacterized protein LOC110430302 isoform X3 [Sorghum bicolor]|uniref:uncharacterized protein LOC110430302 isoform X3 n=1 Tax=Sorghum bicolor TaxID=4558 RepID=UPI000B424311|nr:uncharacterized protein LOC110430302 isoform X3 [Sorghum bicolor]|eukprot:XP_021303457.1 uncharacterized protein LOC110430302 isoform X3 [Sorghum bicolor]